MGKLIPLAIIAITLAWGLAFLDQTAQDARQHRNYVQSQRDMLALDRERHWNELHQQHAPTIAAAQTALAVGSMAMLLAGMGSLTLALWNWAQGIQHDKRFAFRQLEAQRQIAIAQAQHTHPLPAAHYAPHISYQYAPRVSKTGQDVLPGDVVANDAPAAAAVPAFAELLHAGKVGKGADGRALPLLLGYDRATNDPIDGVWLDIYSSALAGMPHSGKTTSQRFLACQLALMDARFVVCDPHMQAGDDSLAATLDPLRGVYLCEPADDPVGILEAIRYVDSIGAARIQGKTDDRTRVVLWVDELNGLLQDATIGPELLRLLKETARQYRKVGVFLSCVAHTWSASSTGGNSDLRANFASRLCHRMERSQARLLLPSDLAAKAESLTPGQAVLHSMRHSTVLQVPKTTSQDVVNVAGLLTADHPTVEVPAQSKCSANEVAHDVTHTAPESTVLPADVARVLALFAEGHTTGEIAQRVYNAPRSGGKSGELRRKVEAVIREYYHPQARAVGE